MTLPQTKDPGTAATIPGSNCFHNHCTGDGSRAGVEWHCRHPQRSTGRQRECLS